ncbi:MAG: hypothetical protein DWH96_03070 [Planctomycetota bacterium]|nr:MAG: hypothetical protein DWH96_03070 [Planctomycetota bacterium]
MQKNQPLRITTSELHDAPVEIPAAATAVLRNVLLQLATAGLFRARWTEDIHREWMRSLCRSASTHKAQTNSSSI